MDRWYRGGCLCGLIEFEANEFLPQVAHCHCSMCRKFHGAEYATFVSVPRSAFRWRKGKDAVKEYKAHNETVRTFCGLCGSSLLFASPQGDPDVIEIALGTFQDDVPVTPDAHIFVGSAAPWSKITDGLPQYEAGRSSKRLA